MQTDSLAAATFAVIDVETTGFDPVRDRVVEVACIRLRRGGVEHRFVTLVNPGRPVPAPASRVHGLYDADLRGAPLLRQVEPFLRAFTADAIVVAHNARFDVSFLPCVAGRPVLCTLRLARRLVDAPSYRNEDLRRRLGLDPGPGAERAHRAEADALVTAALLRELLRRYARRPHPQTVSGLIDYSCRRREIA
jgi:DNA polymerase III epsilon subunit-like protein